MSRNHKERLVPISFKWKGKPIQQRRQQRKKIEFNCSFCNPLVSKFMSCLSKQNMMKKWKNPSNICIKVPDIECQTTGRNVQSTASNENPHKVIRLHSPQCTAYNLNVTNLHLYFKAVLEPIPYCFYWKHRGFWNSCENIYLPNGVLLNDLIHLKLFRSIPCSVMKAIGQGGL